jgi:hypothetical protein
MVFTHGESAIRPLFRPYISDYYYVMSKVRHAPFILFIRYFSSSLLPDAPETRPSLIISRVNDPKNVPVMLFAGLQNLRYLV